MPRLFLTPFVIAGLLFLPSCSSDKEPKANQTEQAKSECDEVRETYYNFSKVLQQTPKNTDGYRATFLIQQYYLLEKKECFTAVQIASAKASIDLVNNRLNP